MSSVVLFILIFSGLFTFSFTLRDLRCQHGWAQFGSCCYRIFTTATTWNDAEQNCVNMGGHLASVHSKEEYASIQALVLSATKSNAQTWLGATNVEQKAGWVWTDGSAFDYSSWSPGQPDNFLQKEHCLEMNYPDLWNDIDCMNLYPSACAKAAIPAKIVSVIQFRIISKEDLLESDTEEFVQKVKERLIDSGMPTNTTFRLQSIYKKPT